ncbi:MAG: PKD domain-containing protein, partial [Planctomycetes bacterium]|nr:PKD domain-containing protein [Planctomycetota bacterium]
RLWLWRAAFAVLLLTLVSGVAAAQGQGDVTPPVLVDFFFTPTSIDVSADAAEVTVTVRMTDELSGVQYGWATFYSATWQRVDAYFPASTRIWGDDHDGVYQSAMTVPRYSEGGTWRLSGVGMYDRVGNTASYPGADLALRGFPTELGVNVNAPPVADAGPDRTAIVGELLAFNGSASSDSDGSVASYAWDFGDGGSARGLAPTHSYSAPGTFAVTLTVADDDGATATDMATVTVQAPAGAIQSLCALVVSYNLRQGVASSLDQKLQNVVAALGAANAGQRQDAANKLGAFLNAVEAQRGKELSNAQADELEALATRILAVL